ncbi:MAG: bacteriocin [Eubacteriales bacterium]|nr:bacteriocin [Eubacteriales bacterium]
MKTKEELNALKEEVETLNRKLHELTEEELAQVSGGVLTPEAQIWIQNNYNEIFSRAPKSQQWMVGLGMNYVSTCSQVFDISTLKETLKNNYGINVDDL